MKQITGYTVVTASDVGDLVKRVAELVNDGWGPLGGVAVAQALGGSWLCAQAMVLTSYTNARVEK